MQIMRTELNGKIDGMRTELNGKIDGMQLDLASVKGTVSLMNRNLTSQIHALDTRLDEIEISLKEQRHERRILRLEKQTGLAR